MRKREYTHVQILLPEMEAMMGKGKTKRGRQGIQISGQVLWEKG